jgi:hypothetical protein
MSKINGQLLNSTGIFSPSDAGYQYAIDTLSYLRAEIIEQKFYEVPIADYFTVDVGQGAYSSEMVQNMSFMSGGDFYSGDVSASGNLGKIEKVGALTTPIRIPNQYWMKGVNWQILEIKAAAQFQRWDVVEERLKSLKKDWDLGIQETAFLGHPMITALTGLINNADLTPNTTLITTPIKDMTTAEFKAFVASCLQTYWAYSNNTALPDTFVLPTTDYLGLGDFVSDLDVRISKIDYLTSMFQKMTNNPKFKITSLAYCQSDKNSARGITKNRYVLYRNDPDTLKMNIPVDFTMFAADTANQTQWTQVAMGQYSGVLITRPQEVLYIDETAATT